MQVVHGGVDGWSAIHWSSNSSSHNRIICNNRHQQADEKVARRVNLLHGGGKRRKVRRELKKKNHRLRPSTRTRTRSTGRKQLNVSFLETIGGGPDSERKRKNTYAEKQAGNGRSPWAVSPG